jgi:small subunit ribosomal protein S20
MANTKSAAKAARQSLKRKAVNDARRSRVKTSIKASETAIAAGDKAVATDAFKAMQGELMRGARKGIIHPNAVARKMSRLSKRIKALKA